MANNANNDKSLESWIWDAACSIRGAKDAPKYKEFILPLIFAKRLCDVFDDELNRIAKEVGSRAKAFKLVKHDKKLVRFFLPLEPKNPDDPVWSIIRKLADKIGEQLTTLLRAIADENSLLKGIIDRVDFNATTHGVRDLDDDRLSNLIERISEKCLGLNDVEADIIGNTETLRSNVAQQYLSELQAEATADLQDSLVVASQQELILAQAREIVGSGTQLDVQRAEVALGLQKVQVLKARNQVEIEKLRLFQLMGVTQPANVKLVSQFPVVPLNINLQELIASAHNQNPGVLALRSRQRVADLHVRREKGEYSPTLSLSTGIGGYTYGYTNSNFPVAQASAQLDAARTSCVREEEVRAALNLSNQLALCNSMAFTTADAQAIRDNNSRFPFNFTKSPRSFSAMLSLPLFDGFAREQRLQEAMANRSDARYSVRAKELALTADVTAAYLTVTTAEKTVVLQEQNAAKARQELKLVQDRYKIGATTFVDLTEARATYERAESERINAIYDYHKAFAILESAVGHPLR